MKIIQFAMVTIVMSLGASTATLAQKGPEAIAIGPERDKLNTARTQINPKSPFAVVNGEVITVRDYQMFIQKFLRGKMYHARTRKQVLAFQNEAREELVKRTALRQEAVRLGLKADPTQADAEIAKLRTKYSSSPNWPNMEAVLPKIRTALLEASLLKLFEEQGSQVDTPKLADIKAYFQDNPHLFTKPENVDIAVILKKVRPSSTTQEWAAAQEDIQKIYADIQAGASFQEMAVLHSDHKSRENKGLIGTVHKNQLAVETHQALDALQAGEVSEPIRVLEGWLLLKMIKRNPAVAMAFEDVQKRASNLLMRQLRKDKWDRRVSQVLEETKVFFPEPIYLSPTGGHQVP